MPNNTLITSTRPEECFFWKTHQEAELDLLIVQGTKKYGFEIKYNNTPKITRSMRIVMEDLKLDKLTILYPGDKSYLLDTNILVTNLRSFDGGFKVKPIDFHNT